MAFLHAAHVLRAAEWTDDAPKREER